VEQEGAIGHRRGARPPVKAIQLTENQDQGTPDHSEMTEEPSPDLRITLLLAAPMAVQTNSRIGMVRRNLASAHKQRRKVSLIEAIKAIKLRAICSKLRLQVALNC